MNTQSRIQPNLPRPSEDHNRKMSMLVISLIVGVLALTTPAHAKPECDTFPLPKACEGSEPTTPKPPTPSTPSTPPPTQPPPPPVAMDPMVFIEVAQACINPTVQNSATSTISSLIKGKTYATCVGGDLRIGTWASHQNPSKAAAVSRLTLTTAKQSGESFAVRITERYLKERFKTIMEESRTTIESGGRKLTSYSTSFTPPNLVTSRITVKFPVLGFDGRATSQITDTLGIDLTCNSDTKIETNTAADIGQAWTDFKHFTFGADPLSIRGLFRTQIADAGTPGCIMAKLIPDYVLLKPIPNFGNLRVTFTPTRVGVLNGNFDVGGTWTQAERNPRLVLSVQNGAVQYTGTGFQIPVRVSPRDLSGRVHVTVSDHGVVRGQFDLPGRRGQEAKPPVPSPQVFIPMPFADDARGILSVTVKDTDNLTATEQVVWRHIEHVPHTPCIQNGTKGDASAGPSNCETPPIVPGNPPVDSLTSQQEPSGVQ